MAQPAGNKEMYIKNISNMQMTLQFWHDHWKLLFTTFPLDLTCLPQNHLIFRWECW
jgi:hypothetical protein